MWNTGDHHSFAATATVILAFAVCWLVVRTKIEERYALYSSFVCISAARAGIVVVLSFIFLYLRAAVSLPRPLRHGSGSSPSRSITQYIAFAMSTTNAAITQIHKKLEDRPGKMGVARARCAWLGKSPFRRSAPSFIAAWLWVAAHAVRAFSVPFTLAEQGQLAIVGHAWHLWDE